MRKFWTVQDQILAMPLSSKDKVANTLKYHKLKLKILINNK